MANFLAIAVSSTLTDRPLMKKVTEATSDQALISQFVLEHMQLSGNRFCDEKNDWLESHKEHATVEEIYKQKQELEELLKPMLSKLEETGK